MEFESRGGPVHTRLLSVRVEHAGPLRWQAQGVVLDLRKRGLVPMAGDLQTAGVIHHMRVTAEIDTQQRLLTGMRAEQPSVAFEASPATGGECCRDPVSRIESLARTPLDAGYAARLGTAIGGALGCSHVLTLAQYVGSAAQRALEVDRALHGAAPGWRIGERVLQRSLSLDGIAADGGGLELLVQQTDVHCAPAPADALPLARLARQHELRVQAGVDLARMQLRSVAAAERSSGPDLAAGAWRDRGADVAWLAGRPAMGGLARALLAHFGEASDAPLRDALLNLAPGLLQCIPAIADRWRAVADRPGMLASGGMIDSCYMWRRDGFLAQRIEAELRGFREGAKG